MRGVQPRAFAAAAPRTSGRRRCGKAVNGYFPITPFHSHYRKEAQNTAHKVHNFRVANYTLGILVRPHQWDGQLDAEQAIPDGP